MGIFDSDYETSVGTSVSRVIKDSALPNSAKTGIVKAIFDDGNVSDYVMEDLVASVAVKAESMYGYAARSYTHGLPSGKVFSATQGKAQVQALLDTLEGVSVLLDYCQYGPANDLHIGWTRLIADHGYNPVTNQLAVLTASKGKPVYLEDMVVVVPASSLSGIKAAALNQWGTSPRAGTTPNRYGYTGAAASLVAHSPVHADVNAVTQFLSVTYVYVGAGTVIVDGVAEPAQVPITGVFTIPITGYQAGLDYFHAKYTVEGVTKYWMYQAGLGTHPQLDSLFDTPEVSGGSYFPFVYFRYNKQSVIKDKTTAAYKTSNKLVKYLGMDYDQVASAIDENPDIDKVEQAMLIMAVPASTVDPLEQRYLYEYFDAQYYDADVQYTSPAAADIADSNGIQSSTVVIKDARFKMALSNSGLYKARIAGSIGVIGTYSSGTTQITTAVPIIDYELGNVTNKNLTVTAHYYRKQIGIGVYDEIQVVNLRVLYHIWEQYTVTADEKDSILLIPLDRSITTHFSTKDKEVLYSRSLHFVFNSRVITEIKWYQQSWFQIVLLIVAVVITIYTFGATGGALISAVIAGNTALVMTLAWALIVKIATAYIIGQALKLFVQAVGIEAAVVIAILVAVYSGYMMFDAGSISGAPFATKLLSMATGLVNASTAVINDSMQDLLKEANEFSKLMVKQTKLLDTANELLEQNHFISPLTVLGETPDQCYNRTVHSGNIGVLCFDAISSYVDIALTLPTFNETIGNNGHGYSTST